MAYRLVVAQATSAAFALALCASSAAQALSDPTRPPLELMSTAAAGAAPRTPLQSIMLSSVRKGAIISGQYVPLGGSFGKAKLVSITATEVTLKSDVGLEVLQLYSPLAKTSVTTGKRGIAEKAAKQP